MMKEDSFYDKAAVRRHGLSGLPKEEHYNNRLRYAIMIEKAVKWLKTLEKHERDKVYAQRARRCASFSELLRSLGSRPLPNNT